jgi:hypothetical protein
MSKKLLSIIEISILLVSILAFTNLISADASRTPLPTNVATKALINSNQSNEEESNSATGYGIAEWDPFPFLSNFGREAGKFTQEGVKKLLSKITVSGNWYESGFVWTAAVGATTFALVWLFGGQDVEEAWLWGSAAGASAGLGFTAGSVVGGFSSGLGLAASWVPVVGWTVGLATAIWSFWRMTFRADQRAVVFDCKTWQAQTGGADCKKCNDEEFPCTEYKCRSLGQSCKFVNPGENARCIYVDPTDSTPPAITPRVESLNSENYAYANTNRYSTNIKYKSGCINSFDSFTFGVELDKEGICKMAEGTTESFDKMSLSFGTGSLAVNHTQMLSYPTGGNHQVYVRCQSSNGKANVEEFVFNFCINEAGDNTAPIIQGFNYKDETPIKYFEENQEHKTNVIIYANKPLSSAANGCKWSHSDKDYNDMEGGMSSCSTSTSQMTTYNAQISYKCSGTLTGLQNEQENKFYFRCNSSSGKVNTFSKSLTLIGSRPLAIDAVSPEKDTVINGSSDQVKVILEAETSAGLNEGEAECYYSSTGDYNQYTKFTITKANKHSTEVYIPEGEYKYFIQCFDKAGNSDVKETEFEVDVDKGTPGIARVYNEGGSLKVVTSEEAECVYDIASCNYAFEDGITMTTTDKLSHYSELNTENNFYIKCKDDYGNQPLPDECSIIVRPLQIY